MSDAQLRSQIIRLAHQKPELRPLLIPVLTETRTASEVTVPKDIAKLMMSWHSSGSDPIYAVQSNATSGKAVPAKLVKDAIGNLERDLAGAKKKQHGWGPKEVKELTKIIKGLKGALKGKTAGSYKLNVGQVPLAKAREYAAETFAKYGQDLDEVLPNFDKNYMALQKKVKSAPNIPRIQMPVIEPSDMDLFNQRLNAGRIDIFEPYAKGKLIAPATMSKGEGEEWVELGVKDGHKTDDVVKGKKSKLSATRLLPTQSQVWLEKLINNIAKWGKPGPGSTILKAPIIVSEEGYILDGHHRFGQAMLADPSLAMAALYVPLKIDSLLEIGRAYGAAIGNRPKHASSKPQIFAGPVPSVVYVLLEDWGADEDTLPLPVFAKASKAVERELAKVAKALKKAGLPFKVEKPELSMEKEIWKGTIVSKDAPEGAVENALAAAGLRFKKGQWSLW